MKARRARRLLRASGLRCLRVARRHHFSLLSAGVLGGALTLVLTSASFRFEEPASAGSAAPDDESPVAAQPATTLSARPPEPPRARLVVYYVIDDARQRLGIEAAVQADVPAQAALNAAPARDTYREFIWARTKDEEDVARDFLNDLAVIAQQQDYQFQVVDLR